MLNADPAELDKFGELAHRWWDPNSEFKPLHDINPLRLDWIDNAIGLRGKHILDVGCGGGLLSEGMAVRGAVATWPEARGSEMRSTLRAPSMRRTTTKSAW